MLILIALAIHCAFPHPTHNQAHLKTAAAEAQHLMATYPLGPKEYAAIPEDKWPAAIASLKPYSVTVFPGMVDITTEPSFDGSWGYGSAMKKAGPYDARGVLVRTG
jgi:hypothetical protein